VVVVPRFLTKVIDEKQLPLGESVWQATIIEVPTSLGSADRQQVFSKQSVNIDNKLLVKDIMGEFPLGLLVRE
jgi:(1->4)-alpha-D-glucan 1-alpha-D-glucosylmutase